MAEIDELLAIMARLRDPERGCPWDVKQDFSTIAPYTIEEAYEVADAIQRGDMADLRDELGDLLLQVVFHARMAEEAGHFAFADVAAAINDKMVRRHPHVFGDAASQADAEAQLANWEELKRREREASGTADTSVLAGIARGLPEWQRAVKLQKRAATLGFDWPGPAHGGAGRRRGHHARRPVAGRAGRLLEPRQGRGKGRGVDVNFPTTSLND